MIVTFEQRRCQRSTALVEALLGEGLEPSWIAPLDPKSSASANFATRAREERD